MELINKITPGLDIVRNILTKVAEFASGPLSLGATELYFFLVLIVSVLTAKKLLEFFYTTLDGRKIYWAVLTGIIFWIIKYLGVN